MVHSIGLPGTWKLLRRWDFSRPTWESPGMNWSLQIWPSSHFSPYKGQKKNRKTGVRVTCMTRAVVSLELESRSYYLCPNLEQKEADRDP